jgi:hypothetical protein
MAIVPDAAVFQTRTARLPITEYQPSENVLSAGSRTGKLFVLRAAQSRSLRMAYSSRRSHPR